MDTNKFIQNIGESGGVEKEGEKESMAPVEVCVESMDVSACRRERSESVSSKKSDASVGAKRRRVVEEESAGANELACLRMIGLRFRKFLFAEVNRVSKSASEYILNCVGEYEEQMMRMLARNERLQGRLDECVSRVGRDVAQNVCGSGASVSYASMAGKSVVKNVNVNDRVNVKSVKERNFAVVVKAKDANVKMTSEQVKEKVMRDMSKSLDVRVKAVRKTRSGGIVVETVRESELTKIRECGKFGEIGLSVEMPRRIGPKMIVYDVPNEMTSDELMKELYEKNVRSYVSESEFKERVRIVNRGGKKGAACGNVILEVPSRVKNVVCTEGRVFVGWKAFRVREFVNVLRCHRCYAYGHMKRECMEKESLCLKCGTSGHMVRV